MRTNPFKPGDRVRVLWSISRTSNHTVWRVIENRVDVGETTAHFRQCTRLVPKGTKKIRRVRWIEEFQEGNLSCHAYKAPSEDGKAVKFVEVLEK